MRIGQNPAKMDLPAYQPKRLGIALLSCIPFQAGYFAQSMEILKYEIASIHNSTNEFDLMVFDNGSCAEVQENLRLLQSKGLIHFLLLSQFNLGKTSALNWIFQGMPNELICYTDSDVYFRPGWYEHSLEILEGFPKVGFVAAQPCFFDIFEGGGKAYKALQNDPSFEIRECDMDQDAFNEFVHGVNAKTSSSQQFLLKRWQVAHRRSDGLEAIVGATHMQFLARREVFGRILPLPTRFALSREDDYFINSGIDEAGFLQLSTLLPFVVHMGNGLDESIRFEADQVLTSTGSRPVPGKKESGLIEKMLVWSGRNAYMRRLFTRIYDLLFRVLRDR